MLTFEWIIGLLVGAVALSALARRFGIPYPTFLALGGSVLVLVPGAPDWTLEPELALALFVAPVLLDAAFDTSLRELRDNWLPVAALVFFAVAVTTAVVAVTTRLLVPDMPWAAAVALGAIVAPPDAAAAVTVLRQVRLPHRLLKILEGESLLNDASALLIYRVAVMIAVTRHASVETLAPAITLTMLGSLIAGYVFARLFMQLSEHIRDVPSAIIMQFATTFIVWMVADRLGLSGILTIVVYAITVARTAPARIPARLRVPSYAVWETVVFLLNVLAFVMIGMQLRPVWEHLEDGIRNRYLLVAVAVLGAVIFARILWVMSYNTVMRLLLRRANHRREQPLRVPTVKGGLVISWCGMRGIVTLAAAFALPEPFPYRDLILLIAFAVVLGTLVVQGLTLKPLILALRLKDDNPVDGEVAQARVAAYRAALDAISKEPSEEAEVLRLEYSALLLRADGENGADIGPELPADPMRRRAIAAARHALIELRASGVIGDDAFHRLEQEFDWAELSAQGAGIQATKN
ncbi:sodium:proton antiporter [Bradyrhizobium sp. WD16]|uniref:cation:proton antiporter n=1 Tax=Bradyrhizobium sp. WD16 TaxID=1521768 RepID=UPI0020A27387|nr:cation:proton antiporter [Bradyrhizobium sp. WD16]UTD26712.1 sodium:proton antiporter [Bradyrhizobium sp. WD16]